MSTRIDCTLNPDDLTIHLFDPHVTFDPETRQPAVSFRLGSVRFRTGTETTPGALAVHLRDLAMRIDLQLEASERGVSIESLLAEGVSEGF